MSAAAGGCPPGSAGAVDAPTDPPELAHRLGAQVPGGSVDEQPLGGAELLGRAVAVPGGGERTAGKDAPARRLDREPERVRRRDGRERELRRGARVCGEGPPVACCGAQLRGAAVARRAVARRAVRPPRHHPPRHHPPRHHPPRHHPPRRHRRATIRRAATRRATTRRAATRRAAARRAGAATCQREQCAGALGVGVGQWQPADAADVSARSAQLAAAAMSPVNSAARTRIS